MSTLVQSTQKTKLSVKTQIFAALGAIVAAIILPQIFHAVGAVSGLGTALGETFLPMHLPILLVGLLAGPIAGATAGAISPIVSFLTTGMPLSAMLPFMIIELCAYGCISGLFRKTSLPTFIQLLIAQIGGRALRAIAILIAVYTGVSTSVPVSVIWTSIAIGLPGILLQWALLPLLTYRIEGKVRK